MQDLADRLRRRDERRGSLGELVVWLAASIRTSDPDEEKPSAAPTRGEPLRPPRVIRKRESHTRS